MSHPKLAEAMRREFSATKLAWVFVLVAQAGALAIVLAEVFASVNVVLAVVAAVAVPIVTVAVRGVAKDHANAGEQFRRALVRSDGWGRPVPATLLLRSIAEGTSLPSWDPPPIGTYYSSPYPPGPRRVAHIVQQSSFFTLSHARTAARACAVVLLMGFVFGAALLWSAAHQALPSGSPHLAQAASAILSFSVVSEFLGLFLAYRGLAASAQTTLERTGQLTLDSEPNAADVAFAVAGYDCTLAASPPIPGVIYRFERGRLEREWEALQVSASSG